MAKSGRCGKFLSNFCGNSNLLCFQIQKKVNDGRSSNTSRATIGVDLIAFVMLLQAERWILDNKLFEALHLGYAKYGLTMLPYIQIQCSILGTRP